MSTDEPISRIIVESVLTVSMTMLKHDYHSVRTQLCAYQRRSGGSLKMAKGTSSKPVPSCPMVSLLGLRRNSRPPDFRSRW
jgi:hypothetical protein